MRRARRNPKAVGISVLEQIKAWIDKDKSIKKVAGDIQLTSELIILVRMMFADGELKPEELRNFKRICKIAFGIPEEDVPEVVKYLQDFGYETTAADAAAMFQELDIERKRTLLVHMLSIAKSDDELHDDEVELIRRTAGILGLSPEDMTGEPGNG